LGNLNRYGRGIEVLVRSVEEKELCLDESEICQKVEEKARRRNKILLFYPKTPGYPLLFTDLFSHKIIPPKFP